MRGDLGIWRALDRARALNLAGAGQRPPQMGSIGVSRRRVLKAMGAGMAVASLPSCFSEAPRRIAVIGGGLAGVVALDRLIAKGIDATLFEARGAIGGRTRSVRGVFAPDYAFDEGGQLVNSDHAEMIALTRSLGLRLIDRKSGTRKEIQIGRKGVVSEDALADDLRDIAKRITEDSDRLDKDYDAVAREIDALSVRQYLDAHGLRSGDARDALEAGIRTEYGAEPDEASALELLFNLPTVDGERLTRLSLSDERFVIDGGTAQVAERLAERHRPQIQLNRKLASIDIGGGDARLGFADGRTETFDRVVLALPAGLLREIRIDGPLPAPWRQLLAEVNLGRNEKIIAGFDTPSWHATLGESGALWAASGFSEAWDALSAPPVAGSAGALTFFLGGDQVREHALTGAGVLAGRFTEIARRALPDLGTPNGRLRRTQWTADPLTRGAYISFRPGQITRFGGLLTVEEPGNVRPSQAGPLIFAGEWLSDAWPGYMNGAVQTGRIAADAAIASVVAKQAA